MGSADDCSHRMRSFSLRPDVCIHWAACGWNLLRNGEAAQQLGDRSYKEMANQYLDAIYFVQTAVVTLGYGQSGRLTCAVIRLLS